VGESPSQLIREFVEAGGRAVITCVDLSGLDVSWLGRIIDEAFLDEIGGTGVDPCGENGEYHSFAFRQYSRARSIGDQARDGLSQGLVSWTCCRSNG